MQCNAPASARQADTECHTRTCSAAGVCGISNTPAGTALMAQTAGDCQRAQCDGAGKVVNVADTADVQIDTNVCTQDLCVGSVPSHPFEAPRTPCTAATGSICNLGNCVQCIVAADCPGSDGACAMRTCSAAGVCGMLFVAAGTAAGTQTAGDCKKMQCDGMGQLTPALNPMDLPVDGNPCTSDVCTGSTPSNPSKTVGAACMLNNGTVCDEMQNCVQCLTDAQCSSANDTPCSKNRCVSKACTFVAEAMGMTNNPAIPDAIHGDCMGNACDGMGMPRPVVNDADVPVSTNPCILTSCSSGMPISTPAPPTTACTTGITNFCDGLGMCL